MHWKGYQKEVIPNELFPHVKFDPSGFDAIKKAQTTFIKEHDKDNNLVLTNNYVRFIFQKHLLGTELKEEDDAIPFAVKAMQQINMTTLRHFFKSPFDIVISSLKNVAKGHAGFFSPNSNFIAVESFRGGKEDRNLQRWSLENFALTVNHEIGHFETMTNFNYKSMLARYYLEPDFTRKFDSFIRDLNNELLISLFYRMEPNHSSTLFSKSEWELRMEKNGLFYNRLRKQEAYDLHAKDTMNLEWDKSWAGLFFKTLHNWFPVEKFDLLSHLNPSIDTFLSDYALDDGFLAELITRLQITQTQCVDPNTIYETANDLEYTNEKIPRIFSNQNEAMTAFRMNLHDENDGLQPYWLMKSIFKNFYGVNNVNSIAFERKNNKISKAFFNSIGNEFSAEVSEILIKDKISKISLTKKVNQERVALGFNRNPFTPYEYKYVADAAYASIFDTDEESAILARIEPKNLIVNLIDRNGKIINDPNLNISLIDKSSKENDKYYDFRDNLWYPIESHNRIYIY